MLFLKTGLCMSEPSTNISQARNAADESVRLPLETLDRQLTSIQPGGGVVIRMELAWGRLRRWYLKTFRRGYVKRMAELRKGDFNGCPHEVLDPRDLKFYRNQGGYYWERADDPFAYREGLPFARVGLAELLVFSLLVWTPAMAIAAWLLSAELSTTGRVVGWIVVAALAVVGGLIAWFFRNPHRRIPTGEGLVVSPADGLIWSVDEIEHDEYIGGPAVTIGIFLSIFNVHINRMPVAGRVIGLRYRPGKYLNALRPESVRENEQLAVRLEGDEPPHRRMVVVQITGAIARRIVCWLKPGDQLERGAQFGMIKLGSRTELVLPREPGLEIRVREGDKVRAGCDVLAAYSSTPAEAKPTSDEASRKNAP